MSRKLHRISFQLCLFNFCLLRERLDYEPHFDFLRCGWPHGTGGADNSMRIARAVALYDVEAENGLTGGILRGEGVP